MAQAGLVDHQLMERVELVVHLLTALAAPAAHPPMERVAPAARLPTVLVVPANSCKGEIQRPC